MRLHGYPAMLLLWAIVATTQVVLLLVATVAFVSGHGSLTVLTARISVCAAGLLVLRFINHRHAAT